MYKQIPLSSYELSQSDKDYIFNMYVKAYSPIGLPIPNDKDGREYFFSWYPCTFLCTFTEDNTISSVIMYWVHTFGNKISLLFSDERRESKHLLIKTLHTLLQKRGWFAELSGAPEHIVRTRLDMKHLDPDEVVRVLGINKSKVSADGWYDHQIGQEVFKKRLYGIPCNAQVPESRRGQCGKSLEDDVCLLQGGCRKPIRKKPSLHSE